jgi:alpha-2-macroglobulin
MSLRSPLRHLIPLLCLFLLLNSCGQQSEKETRPPTEEDARLVGELPAGPVGSQEPLRVRFVEPVAGENQVGHTLQKPVFSFQPPIVGLTRWEDRRTLTFRPNQPLPSRQEYQAELDLPALFPNRKNLDPLQWTFAVVGREVETSTGAFVLLDPAEPRRLLYEGEVIFTEITTLEAVQQASELRLENRPVLLKWERNARTFQFVSAPIERNEQNQSLIFSLDGKTLELSQTYRRESELPPLQQMQVVSLEQQGGEQPGITVEFSDEVEPRQEIAGLIAIEPPQPLRLKVMGKKVLVQGDFAHGQQYSLLVHAGIRSRWGPTTQELWRKEIAFADRKPQIRFLRDGTFLPSANQRKVRFSTLNVSQVTVEIKKVFANNLGFFLQNERLSSDSQRQNESRDHFVRRVGVDVAYETLEIGSQRNIWLQHELDLGNLIGDGDKGLYLIGLHFDADDMLYGTPEEREAYHNQPRHFNRDDYHNHPYSPGYLNSNGRVYKTVALSDIGLTCKQAHRRFLVWATRIDNAAPLPGAEITLRTYQNQIIARQKTDADGRADFTNIDADVFYIEAEKDGQRSLVKPDEMAWNLASFETGGQEVNPDGVRAFVYTERGVYRPGDTVHATVIARHANHTFPDDHPLTLKLFNPRNQLVFEETQQQSRDGFFTFEFSTHPDAPTGNWRLETLVGSRKFSQVLKIETVAPERLKVEIIPDQAHLGPEDRTLSFTLRGAYLFGNPAAGLEAQASVTLHGVTKSFPRYPGFTFTDESIEYEPVQTEIFSGPLNAQGEARVEWPLPTLGRAPSALEAIIDARVLEKGGRPSQKRAALFIDSHAHYVGLQKPELDYGYAQVGTELQLPTVAVDTQGKPVPGRPLHYRIYRGDLHWWWEYENRDEFRLRFRSGRSTELVDEGEITSAEKPVSLVASLKNEGQYLIEVEDSGGHTAAFFLRAYPWGEAVSGGEDAGLLTLRTDREKYAPGDVAVLRFPLPREGAVLMSVEQDARVLQASWHPVDGQQNEARIEIPITAEMAPNAYAAVSVIQPHAQTANDRPLRMYGIVPLLVEDAGTRRELLLELPQSLRPEMSFEIGIQTADRQPTQFTVAVVDEGLLSLTDFATPDPWKGFFAKVRLSVRTFDLFAQILGAHRGDIFRTFSIGGGLGLKRQLDDDQLERVRRFEPVSMFQGPLMTDAQGSARVPFQLPNYVGAVRVMVVAASGRSYGHAEKTVPVKSELMVVSTLPRVLGPEDRISVPATIFAMEDGIGPVAVTLDATGPVSVLGSGTQAVEFIRAGDADVEFQLQVEPEVGAVQVALTATAANARATQRTKIEVRPSAARVYAAEEKPIAPGDTISFTVPDRGIRGTNQAAISVQRGPSLNLDHRYDALLRYPYGCIEQTVSAAFPQLYLKDLTEVDDRLQKDIDAAIDAAIYRLRRYRLADGSFSYWPGGSRVSAWSNLYAGHFLLAARNLGYHVPADMLQNWLRFQQSQALTVRDELRVRTYRVYLLSLAGQPSIAAMNLLRENALSSMDDTEKWLLAAAYQLAGVKDMAQQLANGAGLSVRQYQETGGTYGSGLRDQAILLDMLVVFQHWDRANALANKIAQALSAPGWLSTQTAGYSLMALGNYYRSIQRGELPELIGTIRLPDGEEIPFRTDGRAFHQEIKSGFGGQVEVKLAPEAGVERAFAALTWEGVPLRDVGRNESQNLSLEVEWLDENGTRLDPTKLKQGTLFWAHFRVTNTSAARRIEEVALMQILPAGWEIENARLSGRQQPEWMRRWKTRREEYLDLRDDRVIWFFELDHRTTLDFAVEFSAVTVGEFTLPSARVEAMYNRDFRASRAGGKVIVEKR